MTDPKSSAPASGLGKFIQTYSSFLSTFVIGAAGLVATSIWQYRQSEIAARQAESQQRIAITQAENQWRIERAEILSKNLSVLSATGPDTVEQRYGVLLSLTRGTILDAELAVSYALELGKDNSSYMKSVLASIPDKSYARLAAAFELTCQQRFGTTRDAPTCPPDARVERSLALTELWADEIDAARRKGQRGPLELLLDERTVQSMPLKLTALFGHYLTDLYERRQLLEIGQFEELSVGARLIAALVLAPAQPHAFVGASEAGEVGRQHEERAEFLRKYLFGTTCPGECKGRLIDVMLSSYAESEGRYDRAMRELFTHPRAEVAMGLARLQNRLMLCQTDLADVVALRDGVLVPALREAAASEAELKDDLFDDLLGLLALTADPGFGAIEADVRAAWQGALTAARTRDPHRYDTAFTQRRAMVQATRKRPPAKLRGGMFCSADVVEVADVAIAVGDE